MRIALIDDEQECLDTMAELCKNFGRNCGCPVETVSFFDGETFLDAFHEGSFNAVFMDIYMKGMDGVTAALKLREIDKRCILIFLTSSTQFMPDAFSCHAFEYITKPFKPQRIFEVLAEVQGFLSPAAKYIEISSSRIPVKIPLDKIVSAVTDAHYLNITLTDEKKIRCRMSMQKFIEKTEGDSRFISLNKGITVNAEYIFKFQDNSCIMENGSIFPVRIRGSAKVEKTVMEYNFKKIRERQSGFYEHLDCGRRSEEE